MNDTTVAQGQGKAITLPNGERRIDYIRNNYYTDGVHTDETCMTRSAIKNGINEMLAEAGREGEQIPYQIVFAATKTVEDPRVAAEARAKARADAKAVKDAEKAAEKAAKETAKAEEAKKAAKAAKAAAK